MEHLNQQLAAANKLIEKQKAKLSKSVELPEESQDAIGLAVLPMSLERDD